MSTTQMLSSDIPVTIAELICMGQEYEAYTKATVTVYRMVQNRLKKNLDAYLLQRTGECGEIESLAEISLDNNAALRVLVENHNVLVRRNAQKIFYEIACTVLASCKCGRIVVSKYVNDVSDAIALKSTELLQEYAASLSNPVERK